MSVVKLISPPGQARCCVYIYIHKHELPLLFFVIIRTIYEKGNRGKRNKEDVDNIVDKVTSYYDPTFRIEIKIHVYLELGHQHQSALVQQP